MVKTDVATEFAVSPDGSWLAFVEGYQALRRAAAADRQAHRPRAEGGVACRSGGSPRTPASTCTGPATAARSTTRSATSCSPPGSRTASPSSRARPPSCRSRPSTGMKIGFAAEADKPRGEPWRSSGARIVTMRGDEVIEDGVVVVRENRIAAVGPARQRRGPRRSRERSTSPARRSCPGSSTRTGTARWARTS